jgi:hypothetical protein
LRLIFGGTILTHMEPERPFLVGLICWTLIIVNMYELYETMKQLGSPGLTGYLAQFPYPPALAETILFLTMAVLVVCGICMYERIGWPRYVYIAVMIPSLIQNYLAVSHLKNPALAMHLLEGKFVLYLASIVILFLPAAQYFFNPPKYLDGRN